MQMILLARDADGDPKGFYTGRAGEGWLGERTEAFGLSPAVAAVRAKAFNEGTPLHGLTFEAVDRFETSPWVHTLTDEELEARWALTASLDPRMAKAEREWWESRTIDQLLTAEMQGWNIPDPGMYQAARSYFARAYAAELAAKGDTH